VESGGVTVDVWVRETSDVGPCDPAMLDVEERNRWARLVRPDDAAAYLSLHVLARSEIGRVVGRSAASLTFDRTCPDCGRQHGAPRLLDEPALHVSLSRTRSLVALALSRSGRVGVDVEDLDGARFAGYEAVALLPDERACAARGPADVTAWVRKEAALKALGSGLRLDPTTFATPSPGVPAQVAPRMPWVTVVDLDVPAPYAAAVALEAATGPVTIRRH
jgi:4'-phosphopantetheinyl transferase